MHVESFNVLIIEARIINRNFRRPERTQNNLGWVPVEVKPAHLMTTICHHHCGRSEAFHRIVQYTNIWFSPLEKEIRARWVCVYVCGETQFFLAIYKWFLIDKFDRKKV